MRRRSFLRGLLGAAVVAVTSELDLLPSFRPSPWPSVEPVKPITYECFQAAMDSVWEQKAIEIDEFWSAPSVREWYARNLSISSSSQPPSASGTERRTPRPP